MGIRFLTNKLRFKYNFATVNFSFISSAPPLQTISPTSISSGESIGAPTVSVVTPAFKVQRGTTEMLYLDDSVTITAGSEYTAPADIDYAFIRYTNTRHQTMGTTESGGGLVRPEDFTPWINDPENLLTSITFNRLPAPSTDWDIRIDWEIIEYIGPAGGPNEFIVRQQEYITNTDTPTTGTTITNIADINKVCLFITSQGADNGNSEGGAYQGMHTGDLVSSSGNWSPQFTHADDITTYLSYAAVEFTGSNWRNVQRIDFQNAATAWDTTNTTNSGTQALTTSLLDASKAFLEVQYRYDFGSNGGVDDMGENAELTTSLTELTTRRKTSTDETLKRLVVWVMESTSAYMIVQHYADYRSDVTGPEPKTFNLTVSAVRDTSETSILGECSSANGTGVATPRGWISLHLTSTTNVAAEVCDTGAAERRSFDVVQWPRDLI